jgi:ABC-type amino acid transport substrate-binding protein
MKKISKLSTILASFLAVSLTASFVACQKNDTTTPAQDGKLVVLIPTENSKHLYIDEVTGKWAGSEVDLINAIADEYAAGGTPVTVEFITAPKADNDGAGPNVDLTTAFKTSTATICIGRISDTGSLRSNFAVSPSYGKSAIYAVTKRGAYFPNKATLSDTTVGASDRLNTSTMIEVNGITNVKILQYADSVSAVNAIMSGDLSAYLCYEDEAQQITEMSGKSVDVQVQNYLDIAPENFVIIAKKGTDISNINLAVVKQEQKKVQTETETSETEQAS